MKNGMRRMTALAMVLCLMAGTLALPVTAEDAQPEKTETTVTVTVDIRDDTGKVIGEKTTSTTTGAAGETVAEKTTSTTTTTNDKGQTVTEQTSSGSAATDGGGTLTETASSTTTVTTETEKTDVGNKKTTDTDTSWESVTSEQTPGTETNIADNTTQKTDVSRETVVEGSEHQTDVVDRDDSAGQTHYSGSTQGSETTTVTDTTTTTTVTTNTELKTTVEDPTSTSTIEKEEYSTPEIESSTDWERDKTGDVSGTYQNVEGSEETTRTTETEDVTVDPLAGDSSVHLQMKPNGTDQERKTVSGSAALKPVIPKEGKQKDGSTVTYNYKNGTLIGYTVTRYSAGVAEDANEDNPIVAGTTTDPSLVSETENVYILPQNYTEGTVESLVEGQDGKSSVLTTTVTTKLEDNSGYRIVTTEVERTPYEGELPDIVNDPYTSFVNPYEIPADAVWVSDNKDQYIRLPQKPEASTTTSPAGEVTEVIVEEIVDSQTNVVIGYKTTTQVTDAQGNLKSRNSVTEYGTITSFASTTTQDPDTQEVTRITETVVQGLQDTRQFTSTTTGTKELHSTRVGQEDVYQLVQTDSGLVFIYNGIMYAVEGTSTLKASTEVATGNTVKMDTYVTGGSDSDLRLHGEYLPNNSPNKVTDYYTGQLFKEKYHDDRKDGDWKHIGYGLFADFALKETDGSSHSAKQFMIQDGDEIRYVYCVELGAGIAAGSSYGSQKYTDTDGNNAAHPWNGAEGTIGQIRSVALNGFWGTASGLGSLEAVKDLLRRNGFNDEADRLTAGMALTATQVAIWEFGAKDGGKFGGDGYNFVTWDDGTGAPPDEKTWETIVTLRDLLVDLANTPAKGQAETIDASDIKAGGITLKDKVAEGADGSDTYNTDISFTLDVSTSSINGNLIVKVIVDGKEVGSARLAGENDASLFKWGKIYPDKNGTYTIKDVELAEGVTVDLNLSGTQHLDDGVYVFKGEGNKQDFVGLSKLEQDVNLTISMEFDVTEPDMDLNHTRKTWVERKTDKEGYIRTNDLTSSRTGTQTQKTVNVTTTLYGTKTQTDVITEVTRTVLDWESYYSYTETDGGGGGGDRDEEEDPADAPKTGDTTALLAMVSLLSAGGWVMLGRKKEE